MYPRSMADSDCVMVMGSNMAENHPVAFRWPMKAKVNGATLIHVDPRFTRTSAMADIYAPIRAGSDIAFLGGIINYVIHDRRWNSEPFFKPFLAHYTNASTIVSDDYTDTEDADGVFSGLKAEPSPGMASWQYKRQGGGAQGAEGTGAAYTAKSGEVPGHSASGPQAAQQPRSGIKEP